MIQNRKRSTHNSKQYGFMVSQRTFVLAVPVKPGSSTCTPPPMEHVDNPNSHLVQTINLPSVCVSCADDQSPVLMLPCGHIYCRNCMSTLFEMSLKDRSLIPIKCCNIAVDENCFQDFLNIEDQQLYAGVLEEQQCTHKMYCPNRSCAAFINLDQLHESMILYFACPECDLVICSVCNASHPNITCEQYQALPVDDRTLEDLSFLTLATDKKYARCGRCQHYVEKINGCNSVVCKCKHEFCYACSGSIGSCVCDHDEHAGTDDTDSAYDRQDSIYNEYDEYEEVPRRARQVGARAPEAPSVSATVRNAVVNPQQRAAEPVASQATDVVAPSQNDRSVSAGKVVVPCRLQGLHRWYAVNRRPELRWCSNCFRKKVCFQSKCEICAMRVCATCRYCRLVGSC